MSARVLVLTCIASALFDSTATRATVRLPLDGYCRPGRYFPVELQRESGTTHFTADGCLPCDVTSTGGRTLAPMLVSAAPGSLHWSGQTLPLRVPADRERLVAGTTDVPPATLFPGDRVLPVHLDPADPLPGPPVAWDALDAIVLDATTMARVTDAARSALLASGVTFAAPGEQPPDARWPWRRRAGLWVLAQPPVGPAGAVVAPDAFAPTYGWHPGWSAAVRGRAVGVAVLFSLAVVALTIWRSRWAMLATTLTCAGASIAIVLWRQTLPTIDEAAGDVIVARPGWYQRDDWVYQRASEATAARVAWTGNTRPFFASPAAVLDSDMRTVVDEDQLAFAFHLTAKQAMAFVRRQVVVGELQPAVPGPNLSPMQPIADAYYRSTGDRVETLPAAAGHWPTVVVRKADAGVPAAAPR